MSHEAPICTTCGCAEVQEVKPKVYFCQSCESIFRNLSNNPSSMSGFCPCGNLMEVQCQVCMTGICRQCDISSNQAAIYNDPWIQAGYRLSTTFHIGTLIVPTGPGANEDQSYCLAYKSIHDANALPIPVTEYGYLHRDKRGQVCGPFLYLSEMLACLAASRGLTYEPSSAPAKHLCFTCLADVAPVAAKLIAEREICETPSCVGRPACVCRCCSSSFCSNCLTWPALREIWGAYDQRRNAGADDAGVVFGRLICGILPGAGPFGHEVRLPEIPDLCLPCMGEKIESAKEMVKKISNKEYGSFMATTNEAIVFGGGPLYDVFPGVAAGKKARKSGLSRAWGMAERYATELTERLQVELPSLPCDRERAFQDGRRYATYYYKW